MKNRIDEKLTDDTEIWLKKNDPNYYKNNKKKLEEYPYLTARKQREIIMRERAHKIEDFDWLK